jgi:hypothetical protein
MEKPKSEKILALIKDIAILILTYLLGSNGGG